jgi:hypothetical protein
VSGASSSPLSQPLFNVLAMPQTPRRDGRARTDVETCPSIGILVRPKASR